MDTKLWFILGISITIICIILGVSGLCRYLIWLDKKMEAFGKKIHDKIYHNEE